MYMQENNEVKKEKTQEELAAEILKKYDKESDVMEYTGIMAKIVSAIAITFSVFQIYTALFGVLDAQLQRAVHLGFGLALVYLLSTLGWVRRLAASPATEPLALLGRHALQVFATGTVLCFVMQGIKDVTGDNFLFDTLLLVSGLSVQFLVAWLADRWKHHGTARASAKAAPATFAAVPAAEARGIA